MNKTSIVGFPRIGAHRELKKLVESYFKKQIKREDLESKAFGLKMSQWKLIADKGIDRIPSGDYSYYDLYLDTAFLLNVIPKEYENLVLNDVDTYFAMARGYQEGEKDVKALTMRKWFNTNYHYMIAEIDDNVEFKIRGTKLFDHYREAKEAGIQTIPTLIGPFTFLKLARYIGKNTDYRNYIDNLVPVYAEILKKLAGLGAKWVQLEEPVLVSDLSRDDVQAFERLYQILLKDKALKVQIQSYFGDVRDVYDSLTALDSDAIGLDFVEGFYNLELIEKNGFPKDKLLIAGVVNGKNIWRNDYKKSLKILDGLTTKVRRENIVIGTSCSLLHVPYTVENEHHIDAAYKKHLAFAMEKLSELRELALLFEKENREDERIYQLNRSLIQDKIENKNFYFEDVRKAVDSLKPEDFERKPSFEERIKIQQKVLKLPVLPTTTIGSFPQTAEVRRNRQAYKKGEITKEQYENNIKRMIEKVVRLQEEIGLDVLVHGEFERNDMVEYFGEQLKGFIFTENGWVQSYGTRGVKPPIIFGDIKREAPMTVKWISYAQSLTDKPMKGMLTGPVTILNWSFPREDISRKEICYQIALSIRDEVLDLEKAGIKIIQIDEAALREKLPLRKADWKKDYLSWAIPAFRLVHAKVKPETQIHTHMCYSEFGSIIESIEAMNADVLSCEAARSDLTLLDFLRENGYAQQVGPGLYDIHSPRIPDSIEFQNTLLQMVKKLPVKNLWINPDCGLKTRDEKETASSLKHMVEAARIVRSQLANTHGIVDVPNHSEV